MFRGDISNRSAPIIAFNVDNLLFQKEQGESSLLKNLRDLLLSDRKKFISRKVNKVFVDTVTNLWIKHPYSIYLITFSPYKDALIDILDNNCVTYTSILEFSNLEELRDRCLLQYTYYFDNDVEILSYLSSKNALHIDELPKIIK